MRTRLTSVFTVILMVIAIASGIAAAEPVASEETNDSWIVTLVPGTPAPAVAAGLVSRSGGSSLDGVFEHVLNGFVFSGNEAAAAALQKNPNVVSVTRNGTMRLAETQPEGTLRIEADDTNGAGFTGMTETGTPVRVAVLDSGVLATHADLAPNVAVGEGKNCIDPNSSPDDDNGHGTHVAGTVAALLNGTGVVGVAPNASIAAIKTFDQSGNGSDAQIICGLDHVAALAADGVPTVVNMSFGEMRSEAAGCSSSPLHEAICSLHAMGVVMVAATGNDGGSATSFYPAAYPETTAVSAFTDFNGQGGASSGCTLFPDILNACDETLGWFSNDGPKVDVTAPGVNVLSTTYDGGYGYKTGTSMAAPHVAGVAALVLGANPQLNPTTVKSVLTNTGECPDGAMAGAETCVGHGAWDVANPLMGSSPEPDGITEPLVDAFAATQMAVALAGPDETPPVITLLGANPQYVIVGDGYVEQNATAFDDRDGDISSSIVIDASAVDTAVPGSYPVTYNVSDAAGNAADEVTRTVIVEATPPPVGTLSLTADNAMEAFVNGVSIGSSSNWSSALVADMGLRAGDIVAVAATDAGGVAGFLAEIDWDGVTFVSDTSWKVSTTAPAGWNQGSFDDSAWDNATSYGTYGVSPWGTRVAGFPAGSSAEWIWTNDNDGDNQAYFRLVISG